MPAAQRTARRSGGITWLEPASSASMRAVTSSTSWPWSGSAMGRITSSKSKTRLAGLRASTEHVAEPNPTGQSFGTTAGQDEHFGRFPEPVEPIPTRRRRTEHHYQRLVRPQTGHGLGAAPRRPAVIVGSPAPMVRENHRPARRLTASPAAGRSRTRLPDRPCRKPGVTARGTDEAGTTRPPPTDIRVRSQPRRSGPTTSAAPPRDRNPRRPARASRQTGSISRAVDSLMASTIQGEAHATFVLTVPAIVIVITPAQEHRHLDVLLSHRHLADHHGWRTGRPRGGDDWNARHRRQNAERAAAVAAATCGLVIELHIPNGGMFWIGTLSMILAAGMFSAMVLFTGGTISFDGAARNCTSSSHSSPRVGAWSFVLREVNLVITWTIAPALSMEKEVRSGERSAQAGSSPAMALRLYGSHRLRFPPEEIRGGRVHPKSTTCKVVC